ncbi:MAG: hypothetical protein OEV06_08395 [Anaerolineae bacterium]|nr:hypothetical protein [Anaerolineae bacterium]
MVEDNPKHNRQSTRLKGFDYTLPGAYFITILTFKRQMLFGEVSGGEMRLNEIGEIVHQEWLVTEKIRPYVSLDSFIIMPNHLHGIIFIQDVEATGRSPLPNTSQPHGPTPKSLGAIIAGFKSAATRSINVRRQTPGHPVWHRNYYDRIIQDEKELIKFRGYIEDNPIRWEHDKENPKNLSP